MALRRLRLLKGRKEKAISVLVDGADMLDRLCRKVPPRALALMRAPLARAADDRAAGARRIPAALVADGLHRGPPVVAPGGAGAGRALGSPLTTTSANRAGEPPLTTPEAVDESFAGRLPRPARRRRPPAARRARWSGSAAIASRCCGRGPSKSRPTRLGAS